MVGEAYDACVTKCCIYVAAENLHRMADPESVFLFGITSVSSMPKYI